jgi:hypothetical protein
LQNETIALSDGVDFTAALHGNDESIDPRCIGRSVDGLDRFAPSVGQTFHDLIADSFKHGQWNAFISVRSIRGAIAFP